MPPTRCTTYPSVQPTITVTPAAARWQGWPALLLGALALALCGWLWRTLGRRDWLPMVRAAKPAPGGPPQAFLPAMPTDPAALLAPAEQARLAWGIERFTGDTPTHRLDLPATVRASARAGGLPLPRFARASHYREVWLWTDSASRDPGTDALADAVAAVLEAHGLPWERARFRGLPDPLRTDQGAAFGPRELEERRDQALVVILTDGRLLSRRYQADPLRRPPIDALLRLLAHWRHLVWVDSGGALAGLLARHGHRVLTPAQLVAWLGGAATRPPRPDRDLDLWAALCALPQAPVEPGDALALRARLRLAATPWGLSALQAAAPGPGGRLHWPPEARARLLGWLAGCERAAQDGPRADGLLGRALAFWDARYGAALATVRNNTAAHRRLRAERALLGLWWRPAGAIPELHALAGADAATAAFIRGQIKGLGPAEARSAGGGGPCVPLPWPWTNRGPRERLMLQGLGFGCGRLRQERAGQPGRFWLGLGLAAGLAGGALIAALLAPLVPADGPPTVRHAGIRPSLSRDTLTATNGGWHLEVSGPDHLADQANLPAGATVGVTWAETPRDCVEALPDGAELHWRGTLVAPPRLTADPPVHRRLAVLAAEPKAPGVATLADALLAGGSADQVLIDPHWPAHSDRLTGSDGRLHADDQLLLLTPNATSPDPGQRDRLLLQDPATPATAARLWLAADDWSALTASLQQLGTGKTATVASAWARLKPLAGDPEQLTLGGIQGCHPWEWTDPANGITWVELCGGSFLMGSPESEPGRYGGESPQHRVTLSTFAIARTETTNAQYRRMHQDHPINDDLPVTEVTWDDAQDFCQAVGGSLPTEAHWEYAARAGTTTPWSFGADESALGDHAWFLDNSDGKAHPVAGKAPNPWGLYDMHGNLWEWVADWYGDYPSADQTDPVGPAVGVSRVVRGGASSNRARVLRAAIRSRYLPVLRGEDLGFRCARAPAAGIDR